MTIKQKILKIWYWLITDSDKKNNTNMQQDMQLEAMKQQYYGKYFSWIRPIQSEKVGDVVRVTNVRRKGGLIVAEFNAGSPIAINLLPNHLNPHTGEVVGPPSGTELSEEPGTNKGRGGSATPGAGPILVNKAAIAARENANDSKSEMFKMFSKSDMELDLAVTVKMPDIALIKMMYNNAEDKDKFLSDLSEYVHTQMNTDTIKKAFTKIVVGEHQIIKVEVDQQSVHDPEKNTAE